MKEPKLIEALLSGGHSPNSKMCVMEAAAYVAGERWTDSPKCVSPTIASFLRNWNDNLPDNATRTRLLGPLIPLVLGTKGSDESEMKRSWMAFDWLVREYGPAFMDLSDALKPHAKALRDLGPIYDKPTLYAAIPTIEAAQKASDAARDAARAAAWAAAWDALKPTVTALQESAVDLVKRMAEVERHEFEVKQPLQIGELVIQ